VIRARFTRTKEDFTCGNCRTEVAGNGYTNHCPRCLYSRDVDINPGDRASDCRGMMKPVGIETKRGVYYVAHLCLKCGKTARCKAGPDDDFNAIIALTKGLAKGM